MLNIRTSLNHGQFQKQCKLSEPIEIGYFSVDETRQVHEDRSQMSFIDNQVLHGRLYEQEQIDLNDGFKDRYIEREEDGGLGSLFRWILLRKKHLVFPHCEKPNDESEGQLSEVEDRPDFVFWKGHIAKLMCTPYEKREGWKMACEKLHQTIYIVELKEQDSSSSDEERENEKKSDCEKITDQVDRLQIANQQEKQSDREARMCFWGFRFEGYMTRPFRESGQKQTVVDQKSYVVNTNKAFYSVIRSKLNKHHSFLFGSEIDCCQPVKKLTPPDCYIELKTSRIFSSRRQEDNFYRYKALKWWAQSYLAGVPQITCGFRDDDGIVRDIKSVSTWELPNVASRLRNNWNPVVCLNFLDVLLSQIKDLFRKDKSLENTIVYISWSPGDRYVRYMKEEEGCTYFPDWYLEEAYEENKKDQKNA